MADTPTLTPAEAATIDLQQQRQAMAKRMQDMGVTQDPRDEDTITAYDRRLYGTPVRIEVDVAVPMADLRRQLNTIRAEMTNALAALDRGGPANDRRFTVHRRLCAAKTYVRQSRDEIKLRNSSQNK